MGTEKPMTIIKAWAEGMVMLSKMGFSREEISYISEITSTLTEAMLQYYKNNDNANIVAYSIQDLYEAITQLKNSGFTRGEILSFLDDITDAYFNHIYPDIYEEGLYDVDEDMYDDDENDEEDEDMNDDDDDEDDDDDDDEFDGFDPRKFFPKK